MTKATTAAPKWKMVSTRAIYWGMHIMKPGQVFSALEQDLPPDIKANCVRVDLLPPEPIVEESSTTPSAYRIKARKGGEFFDILDSKAKKVNEQPLSQEEAQAMLKSLQS